jgi:hypothetical protein
VANILKLVTKITCKINNPVAQANKNLPQVGNLREVAVHQ